MPAYATFLLGVVLGGVFVLMVIWLIMQEPK